MNVKKLFKVASLVLVSVLLWNCGDKGKNVPDWNQFRGPNRDGKSAETGLLKSWPEGGPEKLWTVDGIGEGYSTVVISDGLIYITGLIDSTDYLTTFNMNGDKQWQVEIGAGWTGSFPGVRVPPTIDGDNIYTISGQGEISCLNKKDGKEIWKVDAFNKFKGRYGIWGISENLLIEGDKIFYTPAGDKTTMVALNKVNGETIWESETINGTTGYVSPIIIKRGNKNIIVNVLAQYIIGVNAADGKIEFKTKYDEIDPSFVFEGANVINCTAPVFKNGKLFITSGYNHTGVMFDVAEDGSELKIAWQDSTLDNHHGGVIEVDGYLYGSNWINNRKGNWVCQNWNTGEVMYEKEWETKGSIFYADGMLYCYDERKGNIALVEANPNKFEVKGLLRIKDGEGPHWAYPVIHNGIMYIRHGNTISTYNVKSNN